MTILAQLDMPLVRRLVPVGLALIMALATLELVRRRKLREEYAMLWLFASLVLWFFAIFPNALGWLSAALKTYYLTIVVIASFLFLALNQLHCAVVISKQEEEIRQLAERLALMQRDIGTNQKKLADSADTPSDQQQAHTS